PDGRQILFTSYLHGNPDLFVLDLARQRRHAVSQFQGLNSAGTFSPDGQSILLTLSRGAHPNLFLINTQGEILRRLTEGRAIATSPTFAPNGREFAFISDRGGNPQIWLMSIEGGNLRRLDIPQSTASPAWSPRGDKIAFAMRGPRGTFDIAVYELQTSRIIRLTNNARSNVNPTWSPDGRFLVFSSNRTGRWELYIMAIDGSGTRKLAEIPGNSFTPAWSPYL
ncbi:MAG: Tol-Pal system beta propeller repeat protein TolB, partial [Elusimicrobia bacterium]|nr:Tol-Pal system beta propeller repeat protein TolB [Elusimicrobiota bacterium]